MQKVNVENHSFGFGLWIIGWLFTVGYLHLGFWDGALALIIWPYNLGLHFSMFGL